MDLHKAVQIICFEMITGVNNVPKFYEIRKKVAIILCEIGSVTKFAVFSNQKTLLPLCKCDNFF